MRKLIATSLLFFLPFVAFASILGIQQGGTATSTAPVSQLLYGAGLNGYQSVPTTTASCSGSASCSSFTVIGSIPVTISASGGGGSGTVGTSTNETKGTLSYWTTDSATPALLGKVSTTTLSFSTFPANLSAALGSLVGGNNATWTWWGLATTSQPSSSNLLVSNGGAGVYGVATTSVTCSGNTTCSSFTVLGSSPITISSTGGGTGLSTSSPISGSDVLTYSSAGAGSAYGTATGTVSSANTALTVTGSRYVLGGPLVLTISTTTTTMYTGTPGQVLGYSNGGWTGVATTTFSSGLAYSAGNVTNTGVLSVAVPGSTVTGAITLATSSTSFNGLTASTTITNSGGTLTFLNTLAGLLGIAGGGTGTSTLPAYGKVLVGNVAGTGYDYVSTSTFGGGGGSGTVNSGLTGQFPYYAANGTTLTATSSIFLATNGRIGIGTTTPQATVSISATSTTGMLPVLSLHASDGSTIASFATSSATLAGIGTTSPWKMLSIGTGNNGTLAISTSTAGCAQLSSFGELYSTGTNCGSSSGLTSYDAFTHNVTTNSATSTANFGFGTTTPFSNLSVSSAEQLSATKSLFAVASTTNATLFNVLASGNVGIGTSSPYTTLSVNGPVSGWGAYNRFGSGNCGDASGALAGANNVGLELCGSINSDLGGVQIQAINTNNGASAWTGITLSNDRGDATQLHFGGLFLNSSGYTSSAYGTDLANKNQLLLQNTDGLLSLISSTSTTALNDAGINFITGGTSGNERLRITPTGNSGFGTTSPHALVSISSNKTTPAENLFELAQGTGAATSTVLTVATSTCSNAACLGIGTTTPQSINSATTTIFMNVLQLQGANASGAQTCAYVVGTSWVVQSGACK